MPCNIGKVTSVSGNATIVRNGQVFDAGTDITVCKGDKYVNDNVSVVQLTLRDSSVITVGKGSDLLLQNIKFIKTSLT